MPHGISAARRFLGFGARGAPYAKHGIRALDLLENGLADGFSGCLFVEWGSLKRFAVGYRGLRCPAVFLVRSAHPTAVALDIAGKGKSSLKVHRLVLVSQLRYAAQAALPHGLRFGRCRRCGRLGCAAKALFQAGKSAAGAVVALGGGFGIPVFWRWRCFV